MQHLKFHFQLVRLAIFLLLVFNLFRIIFLLFHHQIIQAEEIPFTEIIKLFPAAFWLDIATMGYILIPALLITAVSLLRSGRLWLLIFNVYMFVIILFYSLIALGETGLYGEWKTKLSYKAIVYLKNPTEVFNSVSSSVFILLILSWLFLSIVLYWVYKKWFRLNFDHRKLKPVSLFWILPLWMTVLFLSIRGGFKEIPITTSAAYYSSYNLLNLTAVNPAYNVMVSTLDAQQFNKENLFKSM
ncbi:MAG TPA: hypothetical protein PLC47_04180, partial [Bacteroidales bacterium]|nr:hypothetical protein [Bacteroidales bacterium]